MDNLVLMIIQYLDLRQKTSQNRASGRGQDVGILKGLRTWKNLVFEFFNKVISAKAILGKGPHIAKNLALKLHSYSPCVSSNIVILLDGFSIFGWNLLEV